MKLGIKRGQRGFTLVELMVVMAIIAVLAAIVVPAVSGTKEVSTDAQVKNDAGLVQSALGEYYGDVEGAEIITTDTVSILALTNVAQVISTRWPEKYLQTGYSDEFPSQVASISGNVTAVNIQLTGDVSAIALTETFAEEYNAIDFTELYNTDGSAAYIPQVPASVDETSGNYHNYLWLVKKTTAQGGVASRIVAIFKLTKVETAEDASASYDTLTYKQIY